MKTISKEKITIFQQEILNWYNKKGRHFLWRNPSASNYQKIIVEVLLQRTKAETVAKFLPDFLVQYPSWKKLGLATEDELREALKPLGLYNQRAKRLYGLAQEMKKRNGRFPKLRSKVEEIPMMGQYLTNAFELFILKKPSPLLDVNMARVLERFFGPRKLVDIRYDPYLQNLALQVANHPARKEINWGILDFGAMVCKQKSPSCDICPLKKGCLYFRNEHGFTK